jgi:hypothetical protein
MGNTYGYTLTLSLIAILYLIYISHLKSYAISPTMDEINNTVNQLSPSLSKNESMALSAILVSLDDRLKARGLESQSIENMIGLQLHQDSNHSGILSQSLILLSEYSISNHTRAFRSGYDIADRLYYMNTQHDKQHVFDPNTLINAISTEALNAVGTRIAIEKINTIAHNVDGLLDLEVPTKVLNQIAISIGAHGGNITKSIYRIDNVVKSESNIEPPGPLIQSIHNLFPYYINAYDNIINKIGFDAKGMEDDIDRIIIKDVPIR